MVKRPREPEQSPWSDAIWSSLEAPAPGSSAAGLSSSSEPHVEESNPNSQILQETEDNNSMSSASTSSAIESESFTAMIEKGVANEAETAPAPEPPNDTEPKPAKSQKTDADGLSDDQDAEDSCSSGSGGSDSDDDCHMQFGGPLKDFSFEASMDSDISSESEDEGIIDTDTHLFLNAPITLNDSMLSVLTLSLAHNLPSECINDILQLVALHCPTPNNCKKTLRLFKKHFASSKSLIELHYYCTNCFESLESKSSICDHCLQRRGVGYFIELSVLSQLEEIFKRPGFRGMLKHRLVRSKRTLNNYEDIYDGRVYKTLSSRGNILADENNISLTWHTDGIRVLQSSKCRIWPFYLSINELVFSERHKIENVLLGGLWFGSSKPVPHLFLKKLREDLQQLNKGVLFKVHDSTDPILVRGIVCCGTGDLQAKALFLNMTQHCSVYGCQKCKIKSVKERNRTVYKFERYPRLRNYDETILHTQKALKLRRSVYGVKGPSALAFAFRPIETTVVDIHDVYLGISKILNQVHFTEEHRQHPASLYGFLELYDRRLCSIKPPYHVQRLPRSISEFEKLWDATELKMNLMIFSLPLLQDIMSLYHFEHHMLLVYGLYLLSKDSVSDKCIDLASEMLTDYCSRFEDLYGSAFMTCHVHQLMHLPAVVRDFGPLWVTSSAPYETLNWTLKRFVESKRCEGSQFKSAASLFLNVSKLKSVKPNNGRPAQIFCEQLSKGRQKFKLYPISGNFCAIGKLRHSSALPDVVYVALAPLDLPGQNFYVFDRVLNTKKNIVFSSETYDEGSKHNSSCVKYLKNGSTYFGSVKMYLRVTDCYCTDLCLSCDASFFAIIRKFYLQPAYRAEPGGFIPFIHRCADTNEYEAVRIECLTYVCFFINIDDRHDKILVEPVSTCKVE